MSRDLQIITGTSNPVLAQSICEHLGTHLTPALVQTFSDGEIRIEIGDNVRGNDVFVIQSTCEPVNFHLMQLCLILDALKRASAGRVTAVVPYYGYARQDRKVVPRAPISAKLVADFLQVAGMDRMVTVDLHSGQIQGFFDVPVDNLFASPVLLEHIRKIPGDKILISPDAGGTERARAYAKRLDVGLAIVDKRRDEPNKAKAMSVVGNVEKKICIVIDDMIDTAGTIVAAAHALLENGASEVVACATPPVRSGPAIERLGSSPFARIIVTDTIPLGVKADNCPKLQVASVAGLLAKAVHNIHTESSVSTLFV